MRSNSAKSIILARVDFDSGTTGKRSRMMLKKTVSKAASNEQL